ncbi:unnamed protein product [Diplocarpon coronariae]
MLAPTGTGQTHRVLYRERCAADPARLTTHVSFLAGCPRVGDVSGWGGAVQAVVSVGLSFDLLSIYRPNSGKRFRRRRPHPSARSSPSSRLTGWAGSCLRDPLLGRRRESQWPGWGTGWVQPPVSWPLLRLRGTCAARARDQERRGEEREEREERERRGRGERKEREERGERERRGSRREQTRAQVDATRLDPLEKRRVSTWGEPRAVGAVLPRPLLSSSPPHLLSSPPLAAGTVRCGAGAVLSPAPGVQVSEADRRRLHPSDCRKLGCGTGRGGGGMEDRSIGV